MTKKVDADVYNYVLGEVVGSRGAQIRYDSVDQKEQHRSHHKLIECEAGRTWFTCEDMIDNVFEDPGENDRKVVLGDCDACGEQQTPPVRPDIGHEAQQVPEAGFSPHESFP